MITLEDKFIALSAKLDAVNACISTLVNEYLSTCPREASPDEVQDYRHASTLAFIAADYMTQADKLLWELEADCDTAIQTTRIDVAASVVISAHANQCKSERKETVTCSR